MSHLQGYIHTSYNALVRVFGEPQRGGDKTSVQWQVGDEDIYVYDYKDFCPQDDTEFEFHVGGNSKADFLRVMKELRDAGEQVR